MKPSPSPSRPETTFLLAHAPASSVGQVNSSDAVSLDDVLSPRRSTSCSTSSDSSDGDRLAHSSSSDQRRSDSSTFGDLQTLRQRQSTHRRLAERQKEFRSAFTGLGEPAPTDEDTTGTAMKPYPATSSLATSTMEEPVNTLSSVAPMDTALLSTSTVAQTTESTNAEAASSANPGGSARLVPKLSTSLPIPEALYVCGVRAHRNSLVEWLN